MTATNRYGALHEIDAEQLKAVTALAAGATHQAAADLAGVHRVTVTRWANHHPAFIAELNQLRSDLAQEARAAVARTTRTALDVVSGAIEAGSVEAAFRWLRLGTLQLTTSSPGGPTDSHDIVERVRLSLPLTRLLMSGDDVTTSDAEDVIARRLDEPRSS
jgi:hypothetical protein